MVLGSRGLRDYDAALFPYTAGIVVLVYATAARAAAWLQRPAAQLLLGRAVGIVATRPAPSLAFVLRRFVSDLVLQRFIWRRGLARGLAHLCLSWGSLLAAAVTVPLVLGVLHFETAQEDARLYRVVVFGLPALQFHTDSPLRAVLFNLLNLSSALVSVGAVLALVRRRRAAGPAALQRSAHDLLPLLALLAVAVSGVLMTVSAHGLAGAGYRAVAWVHGVSVLAALLLIPFGKLMHVVQRPLHLCVSLVRDARSSEPAARCRACGDDFAPAAQVADVRQVLRELGLEQPIAFASLCPRCRRRLVGASQAEAVRPVTLRGAA